MSRGRWWAAWIVVAACDQRPIDAADPVSVPAETLTVVRGELAETLLLTGELEAARSTKLSVPRTDTWNIAIRWLAEDGAKIQEGDKLVEFDNTAILESISDQELAVIQAGIELSSQRATNAVDSADKRFEEQRQELELEKAELDATVPQALSSRREFRDFQMAAASAKTALAAAKDDLHGVERGGKLEEDVKRIVYDKALRKLESTERQIDALMVKAPEAGVMVIGTHPWEGRKYQVGDSVWPGMTVAMIPDMSTMLVRAQLSDVDDGRVTVGMRATCTLDAYPDRPVGGIVRGVTPVAREPQRQSERRFFTVVVELDATDAATMRPGLSVKVEVHVAERTDALIVPRAALDLLADPPQAHTPHGDVDVEVGLCTARACEVLSGLEEGDALRPAAEGV